jgi:hypothetical protein
VHDAAEPDCQAEEEGQPPVTPGLHEGSGEAQPKHTHLDHQVQEQEDQSALFRTVQLRVNALAQDNAR